MERRSLAGLLGVVAAFAALATALVSSACTGPGPGPVYDRDLGAAIERLKADVEAAHRRATVAARAAVVADWADALSLAGHEWGSTGHGCVSSRPCRRPATRRSPTAPRSTGW